MVRYFSFLSDFKPKNKKKSVEFPLRFNSSTIMPLNQSNCPEIITVKLAKNRQSHGETLIKITMIKNNTENNRITGCKFPV